MSSTQIALASAAAEVRVAEATLASVVAQLANSNVWSGADAARFQAEWNDLVSARLRSAAGRLDSCTFIPFV